MPAVRVAALGELLAGGLRRVDVNGTAIVLARVGDAVYACSDTCAHQGGPLSEGRLSGTRLACPWHGWIYDVRTGQCVLPGRGARGPQYPVRVDSDEVWLEVGG